MNHTRISLGEGEALFINSGQLHQTFNESGEDCSYLCFAFEPEFLCGDAGSLLTSKYIRPVLQNDKLDYCHINRLQSWHPELLALLAESSLLYQSGGNELELYLRFLRIWSLLFQHEFQSERHPCRRIDERMKPIIRYLESHYQEKITLEQVAREAGFARTYCCREFRKNMNCSLFEYLTHFRLLKSIELLDTSLSITEIAYQCGFGSTSFYIRKFKEKTGVSPNRYRKSRQLPPSLP